MPVNPRVAGGFNTRCSQLEVETANAELNGALRWTRLHGPRVFAQKRAVLGNVPCNVDQLLSLLGEPAPSPCQPRLAPQAVTRQHIGGVLPDPPSPPAPTPLPDVMKPVAPEIRNMIYVGVCKDDRGRCSYLKRRYQDAPFFRWRAPPTVNSYYSWPGGPCAEKLKHGVPHFARSSQGRRDFFRRTDQHTYTGPQREAQHLTCVIRPDFL